MMMILIDVISTLLLLARIAPLDGFTTITTTWNGLTTAVGQTSPISGRRSSTSRRQRHHGEQSHNNKNDRKAISVGTTTELACICINCAYVMNCTIYHFVEEQHEQPHLTNEPTFTPRRGSPRMHVTTRPPTEQDWTKFWQTQEGVDNETAARAAAALEDDDNDADGTTPAKVRVSTASMPTLTTEYDVVKCADFILDEGIWVRNMPEEIKRVNPNFMPP
jgi:hypothetical protein